jgi:predicted permease
MKLIPSALRHAARRVWKDPLFALVAAGSIALATGASAAIFGLLSRSLLAPLPYPEPGQLVQAFDRDPSGTALPVTFGTYLEVAARSRSFSALAVLASWQPGLAAGEPERLRGSRVSAGFFGALGVAPIVGRDFAASDDRPAADPVVLLGASLAQRRFGGAAAALGRTLELDGALYTVVGVLPESFEDVLHPHTEIWAPLRYAEGASFDSREWGHHLDLIGRLVPGLDAARAAAEVLAIGGAPVPEMPRPSWATLEHGLRITPLADAVTSGVRPALLAASAAVLLLVAIACANVTNLVLARGIARQRELATRLALGASAGHLARQLVWEVIVVAAAGAALGLLLAATLDATLASIAPLELPRSGGAAWSAPVLLFATGTGAFIVLVAGLLPSLRLARGPSFAQTLRSSGGATSAASSLRRALLVAQVALTVVLLAGAGLVQRSVALLLATDTGFDPTGVLTMQLVATAREYRTPERATAFFERALAEVRRTPGVLDAALTSQLPLGGDDDAYGVLVEPGADAAADSVAPAFRYTVTPRWLDTMGIRLLAGRPLDAGDDAAAPPAVLVSESFATSRFGGNAALGKRLRMGPDIGRTDRRWATIVGIVADVKQRSLAQGPSTAVYTAPAQWAWVDSVQTLVVRTREEPASLTSAIRHAIASVDDTVPIARITTMTELVAASEGRRAFARSVFAAFGLAALALAAAGLYGIMAASVIERTREIGVRSALGATPLGIAGVVLRQGLTLTLVGLCLGIAGALAATRGLGSLTYGVTALDPPTYASVVAALLAVACVACAAPALRAARVEPTVALRAD